ncbi:MAG: YciI family protein, partial [Gammaproteobacteria bacterium]
TAATLKVRDGKLSVADGPFAETKEQLGGYFLIEARDLNEAIQHPNGPAPAMVRIEVRSVEEQLRPEGRY